MTASSDRKTLVIASRQSPLAQAQAALIRQMLEEIEADTPPDERYAFTVKTYVTAGDRYQRGRLTDLGGKGLFTREVEMALLTGEADIAVHSLKDMPALMPEGLKIGALPKRDVPYDAFLSLKSAQFTDLPRGAVIGTASVRRAAQTRHARPDLEIAPLRGNVGSRLDKLTKGEVDGTFLAIAGLRRLGLGSVPYTALSPEEMLPAPCQGALLVQIRAGEPTLEALVAPLTCPRTEIELTAERALLAQLDGSCQTPIAGLAELCPVLPENTVDDKNRPARISSLHGDLRLRAALYAMDGSDRAGLDARLPITPQTVKSDIHRWAEALGETLLYDARAFWSGKST